MSKIGIITLNGNINYGNRLQNYALQETLKRYNYEVETLWIKDIEKKTNKRKSTKNVLSTLYRRMYLNPLNEKREKRFKDFSSKYISETKFTISENDLPKDKLEEYDYFVTGSDQVWNPYFTKGSPLYLLTFAPQEKRIAYAPSFGISEIPIEFQNTFEKGLSEMAHLSVREDAGAKIIKKLTGRESSVVADPTMLLTKEDWQSIANPAAEKPQGRFLLTYFLGEIPIEVKQFIEKVKKEHDLTVVNLANPKIKKYYLTDPAEFLDYINSASLFLTDSFHGTVFSILFETPFIITDRAGTLPSMNSRIKTILSTFEMEKRHFLNVDQEDLFGVDFSHVDSILSEVRENAKEYLNKALDKNEG